MGELDRILREGAALHDAGKFIDALALYDEAMKCWPNLALLWNNRGNTLLELCRYSEAAESYQRALKLAPGFHDSRVALASCLQSLGYIKEALASCDAVIRLSPDHAEAHWNRALLLLLMGDYHRGWKEYEWRWKKRRFTSPTRNFLAPVWQGEPLDGRSIFIHAEQGFGDSIQFCRYLPLIVKAGGKVIFECHPPLVSLMKTLGDGIEVIPMGEQLPPFDIHIPLLSLPALFGTTIETVPSSVPYLLPPQGSLAFWSTVVPRNNRKKVGICWSGKVYPDPGRSVAVPELTPLGSVTGVDYFSLQIAEEVEKPVFPLIDITMLINDFADTAALVSQMDMVISIDTAVAHLAGSLGIRTWLLVPYAPDWRWGLEREDSPWYPCMRLYRQQKRGEWGEVLERVAAELPGL